VRPYIEHDDVLYTALFIYTLMTAFVSPMKVDIYTETGSLKSEYFLNKISTVVWVFW